MIAEVTLKVKLISDDATIDEIDTTLRDIFRSNCVNETLNDANEYEYIEDSLELEIKEIK